MSAQTVFGSLATEVKELRDELPVLRAKLDAPGSTDEYVVALDRLVVVEKRLAQIEHLVF